MPAWILLGVGLSAVLGYLIERRGLGVAVVAVTAVPLGLVILQSRGNGLVVGVAGLILVPYWIGIVIGRASPIHVAFLMALVGLAVGLARAVRPTMLDLPLVILVAGVFITWNPTLGLPTNLLVEDLLALGFYIVVRLTCDSRVAGRLAWTVALAGGIASLTVLLEFFVVRHPLFIDGQAYAWNPTSQDIFRPGGVFGSPPAAAAALSMTALYGVSLLASTQGARRKILSLAIAFSVLALAVTFTRAGWIGFGAGLLTYAVLSGWSPVTRRRASVAVVLLVILAAFVIPFVSASQDFQQGVLRPGTFAARGRVAQLGLPVATDSVSHLLVGHGYDSLLSGLLGGPTEASLAVSPRLTTSGPHDEYLRILIEQGLLLGLAPFVLWMAGSVAAAAFAVRGIEQSTRRLVAGLAGAVVSFAIISTQGDTFRDPQLIALLALTTGVLNSLVQRPRFVP